MKLLILFVCLIPTLFEVWQDRNGESKKDKVKDGIVLALVALVLAGGAWWLGQRPLPVIGLIIGWRILIFDYLVTWVLIRNKVINPNAKWFDYTGQTASWDKMISRINPWVRLALRVALFGLAVWWFL